MHTDNSHLYQASSHPPEQLFSNHNQYDHYFSSSHAPEVTLEVPSAESSRRPSQVSISQLSTSSSCAELHHRDMLSSASSRKDRRSSFSCNIALPSSSFKSAMLNLPLGRSRGSSMAGSVSAEDLYRMRNFSTSGKRIINKGDSILSRSNLSINQIGSR